MARSLRASAVAAAQRIQAQMDENEDYDDAVTAPEMAKTTTHARAAAKRVREKASSDYDGSFDGSDANEREEAIQHPENEREWTRKNGRSGGGRHAAVQFAQQEADPDDRRQSVAWSEQAEQRPPVKKRKGAATQYSHLLHVRLFSPPHPSPGVCIAACCPPERLHSVDYHRPLLLDGVDGREARRTLLAWYDRVSASRGMPWRRGTWLDPRTARRDELARRAYEVWISEIMAQQTRIAVVIGYWTRWVARWPTMADLAAAEAHEVMREWSGLGYYNRAARLHEAARLVVSDPIFQGLLPADVPTLEQRVPGVGRYTAGAISAIVFGRSAAMVDGNVIRVLSRQLGLFADSKADKQLVDLLWAAADALVQAVAKDTGENEERTEEANDQDAANQAYVRSETPTINISDRPGRWGQALMELGSTVCTPKPDCSACPISSTCRAYAEGLRMHRRGQERLDVAEGASNEAIEYLCDLCEPFPELDDEEVAALAKADQKQDKEKKKAHEAMSSGGTARVKNEPGIGSKKRTAKSPFFDDIEDVANNLSDEALVAIVNHARTFPLRRPKKPVRELDTLVCAVRAPDGRYLLQKRPDKGLLARLWQLPSHDLEAEAAAIVKGSKAAWRREAQVFVTRWLGSASCQEKVDGQGGAALKTATSVTDNGISAVAAFKTTKPKELGSVLWLFSHLRQTMHVYLFNVAVDQGSDVCLPTPTSCRWVSEREAEETYSMGTGMRKCWDLVKAC